MTYAYTGTAGTPREVVITSTSSDDPTPYVSKITYTAWMKVSQIRNCDAFGNPFQLAYFAPDGYNA